MDPVEATAKIDMSSITVKKIKKRDGRIVDFDPTKIAQAVFKAAHGARLNNIEMSKKIAGIVVDRIKKLNVSLSDRNDIEKIVKDVLIEEGHHSTSEQFSIEKCPDPLNKESFAKAILEVAKKYRLENLEMSKETANYVVQQLESKFNGHTVPSVEDVQDMVEKALVEHGHTKTAKAYILYRQKRAELRNAKAFLGVEDDLKLPLNAIIVLEKRYLKKDENGRPIETPRQLFSRVARAISSAEKLYNKTDEEIKKLEEEFFDMMVKLEFLPNSPTLMNAGTDLGQLSACFVLPVEDSIESIFDAIKYTAIIHKSGGGTGFSFTKLRPRSDMVRSTGGIASGPLSFMTVFDAATDVIKQGGKRRGANMGILRVDHPDILDFIVSKETEGVLKNFNISVALTDKFMDAVTSDKDFELLNPRNGKPMKRLKARAVWNLLMTMTWKNGEPGIIFIDRINQFNPTPNVGKIEATNPCGEQPLLSYESCNLGSINLSKMTKEGDIDWDRLRELVRKSVHFLDNVIDMNKYPIPEIEKMTKANRKIGLGVMGFADMLIELGIPYNSLEAVKLAETVMKFISDEARKKSVELGEEKGSFPNFTGSLWEQRGYKAMRNATLTTVAPTGTISIISGCSSGIEPLFAITYMRNVEESLGQNLIEINPLFENVAIKEGFHSEELIKNISKKTSILDVQEIPEDIRKIFVTAHDISPEWHLRIQGAFQKYTDNAVSKTVNFPFDATPHDIEKVYMLAHRLGCKGVTIYRDRSRKIQIIERVESDRQEEQQTLLTDPDYSGGCPTCSI